MRGLESLLSGRLSLHGHLPLKSARRVDDNLKLLLRNSILQYASCTDVGSRRVLNGAAELQGERGRRGRVDELLNRYHMR